MQPAQLAYLAGVLDARSTDDSSSTLGDMVQARHRK
jgi:hypothetical protein